MTLDEARTDLSIQLEVKRTLGQSHQANALKLGVEALKFKHEWDMGRIFPNTYRLPGETKE